MPRATSGSATTSSAATRGTVRKELTYISDRVAAHRQHGPRRCGGEVDELAAMLDDDLAGVDAVVAVEHLQDRAFPAPDGPAEHGIRRPSRANETPLTTGSRATAQVHVKALFDLGNDERRGHGQTCRMEETRSCV